MSEQPSADRAVADRRPRRWGRRVATAVVWAAMIYAAVAGLVSVIPQVFWPQPAAWARAEAPEGCVEGLRALQSSLMAQAADQVATGGRADTNALLRWLAGWDERYIALAPRCGADAEREAYDALGSLRHRMETFLHRYHREQGELARELDHQLQQLASPPSGDAR